MIDNAKPAKNGAAERQPLDPELCAYGWTEERDRAYEPFAQEGLVPGRVVAEHRGVLSIRTADGELEATVPGALFHRAKSGGLLPAVGDWVAIELGTLPGEPAKVREILTRTSKFSRQAAGTRTEEQVVAANIETVLVVMGLDADFNLRRLERFLVSIRDSGAEPVVILNKEDLVTDIRRQKEAVESVAGGAPVVVLSAKEGTGLEELNPFLRPGATLALVGSSGAGKSTLLNRLYGARVMATSAVRASDDRGRHTTRHRQLVRLPCGTLLIDNPGIRELQVWEGESGFEDTFDDIAELALGCRFRDCHHDKEPGCAVRTAVEAGELDSERFESYVSMEAELAEQARRIEERAKLEGRRSSRGQRQGDSSAAEK